MVITFVVDNCLDPKNGTSMTAYRFIEGLRARGHEVRTLTIGDAAPDNYFVEEAQYGFISEIGHWHGFRFAKFDEKTVRRALEGSDIVHFLLPLPFEIRVYHLARKMGIPCSAAFHMQPENASHIIHIDKVPKSGDAIYKLLYQMFYKNFRHIHCPSHFIAQEMKDHGYDAKLYVISNGVDEHFRPTEVEKCTDPEKFNILMVGRLSPEKRQEVLIEAVQYSKYADKIQIYLAGAGSQMRERHLRKLGEALSNPPIIEFYSQEDLVRLINSCDLYTHTATVEIEAISCLEALSCGLVLVICDAPKSATVQFALDENSLFRADDPKDLAAKIDYWIEHPQEKALLGQRYAKFGDGFRVSESVKKAEFFFWETIRDHKKEKQYG